MTASRPPAKARGARKAQETDLGFNWGLLNTVLLGFGVVVLTVGYVALSKGSITLAPVLLVLGYCVLLPASLLVRRRKGESGE